MTEYDATITINVSGELNLPEALSDDEKAERVDLHLRAWLALDDRAEFDIDINN